MESSSMLEHFAEELRLARAANGMSQAALAEALSYSGALVAKVETSERRPSLDFARRCDAVFGADGRFERIQRRISREAVVPWFRDWAGIEQETTALRWFEPLYVPGLVQTEDYARAILAGAGLFAADEVEQQVTARLDRQGVLTRDRPPLLSVVVDEYVLRRHIGGPEVMREQLRHLVKLGSALPRVRIQVVPLSAGAYAGLDGPFVIATAATGEDVVFLDGQRHGQVIDRVEYVRQMVEVWESIRGEALSQQQSLDLIAEVAETWS
ncbi:helix-turn-helix domain-containing protein [Micromonospora ureilytica]|uniref:Transcriptional regulator with XRE-family HTH domain n=1 Tax=Micromonospora ureilytica TaxID=709868 RepID=A0ABS0J9I2_9ACTN|nr:helix-turn-helix transcriptional regulator [Micromonospora ureilytica]MBG6063723.1 transcriptional regulator with XRE-family HTH domain [Micromonospora ureilytica]WSR56554.1 helix-turn-helix transcriptional regulator [Micromonospora ureilytica]